MQLIEAMIDCQSIQLRIPHQTHKQLVGLDECIDDDEEHRVVLSVNVESEEQRSEKVCRVLGRHLLESYQLKPITALSKIFCEHRTLLTFRIKHYRMVEVEATLFKKLMIFKCNKH